MTDFVVIGGVEWSTEANQPPSQVARALAKRGRVLYVYSETQGSRLRNLVAPIGRLDRRRVVQETFARTKPRQVSETLWVMPLRGALGLLPLSAPEVSRRLNAALLTRSIRVAMKALGFHCPVLWLIWWFTPEVLELPHDRSIYDRIDAHDAYARNRRLPLLGRAARALEQRVRADVDVAVSVSPATGYVHVPNGVDLDRASTALSAHQPRKSSTTTVVYCGAVDHRLDWDLVCAVARLRPSWEIDFFGEISEGLALPPLPPNVHLHGWRSHAELLRIAADKSVGIIPFAMNTFTMATSPLKLLDYFIAGTPVVASPLPALVRFAEEAPWGLELVSVPTEWVAAVERLTAATETSGVSERLRAVAARHSVDERVQVVLGLAHRQAAEGHPKHSVHDA